MKQKNDNKTSGRIDFVCLNELAFYISKTATNVELIVTDQELNVDECENTSR